jgi:flagellar hook-length control protein FliK
MPSIAPLTLLPPNPLPRNDSNSTSPSDSSFGDALRKAQDRSTDSTNDTSDPASQPPQPTDSDSSTTGDTTQPDKTDTAGAPKKAAQSKATGAKATGAKAAGAKKKTDSADDSDGDGADGKAVGAELPVEDATAKPGKKLATKSAESKKSATASGAAVAAQPGVKPDKTDPAKAVDGGATPADDGSGAAVKAVDGTGAEDAGVDADPAAEGTAGTAGEAGLRTAKGKTKGGESKSSGGNADATLAAASGVNAFVGGGGSNADGGDSSDAVSAIDGKASSSGGDDATPDAALAASVTTATVKPDQTGTAIPAVKLPPQQQFVEDNHPKIVTGVTGQLLPNGGTMQIRLDPQNLGAIQVTVHMKDGVMSAAFETSSDDSTRMLSHSLGQLKSSLEAGGIAVDKMHVQQSAKKDGAGADDSDSKSSKQQDAQGQSRRDQQRQELIKRMWAKLSGGDPLDLVA